MKVKTEINSSAIRSPESELPPGWRWVRLGELFHVQQGVAMSPNRRQGISPRPFLRTLNVLWGRVNLSTLDEMDFTDEEVAKLCLKHGDLLVCEGGEVGRTAIWRGEVEVCLHQNHIHRLRRLNDSVVPEFYMYWMQAAFQVFGSYSGQESKTTIPNLSGGRLKSFRIPLPPIEEQKRIAAKTQELMRKVERARSACEKQLEAAKGLSAACLREVFESDEAKKWERKRLGEVCNFRKGKKPITLYEEPREGRFPYILIESFSGAYKKFADDESCPRCTKEDVLLVWDGARSGLCTIGLDGCIGSTICALRSKSELYSKYLFWFIRNHYKDLNKMVRGTGIPHLEKEYVYSLAVPLPPLTIQQRIAAELKEKMAEVEKLRTSIENQLESINTLPQAILRKAFKGEL
ncbi:restriction endonuclease subunit S [Dehalococcoidia bacterium]|nr:restriction endonuclease subunit S [Dehalococcoidia bacterium]